MEQNNQAPAPEGAPANPVTTELPLEGAAPPADGVVDGQQQPAETAPQPNLEEEARARNRKEQRFSELSRRANEAEREAAYWRGIAEGKAQNGAQPPQTAQPAPNALADGAPDPANYPAGEFDPSFIRDLARHTVREERAAMEREDAEKQSLAVRRERWQTAVSEADELGYDGGRSFLERAPVEIVDSVAACRSPALVAEYFSQYPDHYRDVARMDPAARAAEIGYIAADLARQMSARTPARPAPQAQAPNAHQPNTPVMTATPTINGRGAMPSFNPETASMDDYARARAEGRFL